MVLVCEAMPLCVLHRHPESFLDFQFNKSQQKLGFQEPAATTVFEEKIRQIVPQGW